MDYLTIEVEEEAMATEYASLPQRQSTEEMEPFVELQELVTVRDEEMDFTPVEEEELNSAQRYRGVDRKMENCGSFVLWAVWTVPGRDWPKVMAVVGAGVASALPN
ncbi:hypothetical protein MUG91_G69n122 [Manis pentadactyla]|nr:hypothetical protein MUG91_G69n122 [Manis pentadactyla]